MADNDGFDDAQQGSATIVFKVKEIKEFAFGPMPLRDIKKRLGELQDDIAGETFANHYIGFVQQQVPAFDIPDEADVPILLQQRISRLGENIPLPLFFADIQQPDTGTGDAED